MAGTASRKLDFGLMCRSMESAALQIRQVERVDELLPPTVKTASWRCVLDRPSPANLSRGWSRCRCYEREPERGQEVRDRFIIREYGKWKM